MDGRRVNAQDLILRNLKRCLVAYVLLLILEGSIRKWLLPQLSAPLLFVRDPLAVYAIFLAFRLGTFSRRIGLQWLMAMSALISLGALLGMIVREELPITLYIIGIRTYFLHLPLIWIFAEAFNRDDCEHIGRWLLRFSPVMAALMVFQYIGKRSDWINLGAGGGTQISANIGEKIRAAGTFSYNSGSGYYFGLIVAFAIAHLLMSQARKLDYMALASAVVAVSVSISRSTVAIILIVAILPFTQIKNPFKTLHQLASRQAIATIVAVFFIALSPVRPVVMEGFSNFETRRISAAGSDGGFLARTLVLFDFLPQLYEAPLLGNGIALGTNAGAQLTTGQQQFLLEEWDWPRHVSELGPLFGTFYIGIRISLTLWLLSVSLRASGNGDILPIALWCSLLPILLAGNIAVPMHMGFAVVIAGLLLASVNTKIHQSILVP
jgi:hypothetical protein